MSETPIIPSADQLPILPETQIIEPIFQCGVLYLGTEPPSPGSRGLDSIQEALSHRYPVDGTNTVRGIDATLSIYNNGIQLTFTRQPHVVMYIPLSSLIYCASLRFSIIDNHWRFVTLDSTIKNSSKHPPLFCAVVKRTQVLSGDECHCFITKNDDDALTLVRIISEIYGNLTSNVKPLKTPIFYQLDRYGRKLSETSGTIYISPATDDDCQLNQLSNRSISRSYLLDPSFNGYFYRSNASTIESWQLWDNDDISTARPRPPDSPFGQHEGLYHDDITPEIHRYLRQMDDEEDSSSSCSSLEHYHHRHNQRKIRCGINQLNALFDPLSLQNNTEITKPQQTPIIIEKILPNPIITKPQNHTKYISEQPRQSFDQSVSMQETNDNYRINDRDEKLTNEDSRIVSMDVIPSNTTNPQPYITPSSHSRSYRRRRRSRHIPVIDLQTIKNSFHDKPSKQHRRRSSIDTDERLNDHHSSTSDILEIVGGYFEDYKGRKLKLNGHDARSMLDHLQSSSKQKQSEASSIISSTTSSTHKAHRRHHSTLSGGPSISYVERPSIRSPSPNDRDGTIKTNNDFISPLRYMQSSINPLLLR